MVEAYVGLLVATAKSHQLAQFLRSSCSLGLFVMVLLVDGQTDRQSDKQTNRRTKRGEQRMLMSPKASPERFISPKKVNRLPTFLLLQRAVAWSVS